MRTDFASPERSLRSELLSLLAVVLVPVGIISVFPYRAINYTFKPSKVEIEPFASLVFLSEEEEIEAIERARSAWQTTGTATKAVEIDLSMENLPEFDNSAILESPIIHVRERLYTDSLEHVPLSLPSLAAELPEKIEISAPANEKFFSDQDLLNLK